jgi:4-phosphopantoate--beta-alanine ligase
MKKTVIAIDLNPLSRTARSADLTIVDELTRALPAITRFCRELDREEALALSARFDNRELLREAVCEIIRRLEHALD